MAVIKSFNLDLSNIPAAGAKRAFQITSSGTAEFILEVRDNTTGNYYNFNTNLFQSTSARLENTVVNSSYSGFIKFPAVTGSSDKYDIYLYAKPGTVHSVYREVRFNDGSLDINSSTGSNSLALQKVIYQYEAITLTLQGYSPNSSVTGTFATQNFLIDKYKSASKTRFSITTTANAASSYRITKQPSTEDLLSYLSVVIGSTPELLPGEDEYPVATAAFTGDDVNGATTDAVVRMDNTDLSEFINVGDKITSPTTTGTVNGAVSSSNSIRIDEDTATVMAVGDQLFGCDKCSTDVVVVSNIDNSAQFTITLEGGGSVAVNIDDEATLTFSSKVNRSHTTVTVVETGGAATDFTMSQEIGFRDNQPLTFTPRKNKRWPVDNINGLSSGNYIIKDATGVNATSSSFISDYVNTVIINEDTENEQTIIKDSVLALDTKNKKPTIVDGFVTVQEGSVVFNNQQILALGNNTVKIAGYGQDNILSSYGYEVLFTDLAISLNTITTTTTSAVNNSTTVPVSSINGVLPGTTTVSGIGIDASTSDPIVSSRSVTSGAGNLELDKAQTLESGITLTYANSGQIATITGNIEIIKAGTSSQTIYFDVEKLLSMS